MSEQSKPTTRLRFTAGFAVVFGLITLFAGGSVALGFSPARQAAGSVVEFVVWFNFLAGAAYVLAGFGLWRRKAWAFGLSAAIALATGSVLVLFFWQISSGIAFEPRTGYALGFRTLVWVIIALIARTSLKPARS